MIRFIFFQSFKFQISCCRGFTVRKILDSHIHTICIRSSDDTRGAPRVPAFAELSMCCGISRSPFSPFSHLPKIFREFLCVERCDLNKCVQMSLSFPYFRVYYFNKFVQNSLFLH